jgi:hypothetical protein
MDFAAFYFEKQPVILLFYNNYRYLECSRIGFDRTPGGFWEAWETRYILFNPAGVW